MEESWDGQGLDQEAFLIKDHRNRHISDGEDHIDFMKGGEACDLPLKGRGSSLQDVRIPESSTCKDLAGIRRWPFLLSLPLPNL